MSLKDTVKNLKNILHEVTHDLSKAENGNKAASQRVRTGTIKLEKVAKLFRKESIKSEKSGNGKKPKASKPVKAAKASAKPSAKPAAKPAANAKKAPKAKAKKMSAPKASAPKGKQPTKKKATAKILKKK